MLPQILPLRTSKAVDVPSPPSIRARKQRSRRRKGKPCIFSLYAINQPDSTAGLLCQLMQSGHECRAVFEVDFCSVETSRVHQPWIYIDINMSIDFSQRSSRSNRSIKQNLYAKRRCYYTSLHAAQIRRRSRLQRRRSAVTSQRTYCTCTAQADNPSFRIPRLTSAFLPPAFISSLANE